MRAATLLSLGLTVAVGVACATTGSRAPEGGQGDVVSSAQIRELQPQYDDMYSLLQNVKPNWLRTRGGVSLQDSRADEPVVFMDGNRYGELRSLENVSPRTVGEVEYLSAGEATLYYGSGYAGGIIMIRSR